MKRVTLVFLLLCGMTTFAQDGINYKALIKDNLGAVVASQTIDVRFTIIADTGPTTVYSENHSSSPTDANGIVILTIGGGSVLTGVFADIPWGSDLHSLKVEIDIEQDGSFIDMGTTQFMSVPYAISSKKTESVSGTANFIPKFNDGSSVGDSQIFDDGTNVGIGTASPLSKFHIVADGIGLRQQLNETSASLGFWTNQTGAYLQTHTDFPLRFATNNGTTQMALNTNGNLGIGIVTATAKLDVAGNIKIADGTQGIGKILTSDADGLASWEDASITETQTLANVVALGNTADAQLKNVTDPTDAQDAATKAYVDALIATLEVRIAALESQPAVIGDLREGGIVFWVDPADNTHGLVCALSDYATTVGWGCFGTDLPNVPNVPYNGGNPTGLGTEIGDGINNTNNILNDCPSAPAAIAARALGPEWFLPSAKELKQMFINKTTLEAAAGFSAFSNSYWSSTESASNFAWYQFFNVGALSSTSKNTLYYVRAIRAF